MFDCNLNNGGLRRPIVGFALAHVTGICAGWLGGWNPFGLLLAALPAMGLLWLWLRRGGGALVFVLAAMAGALHGALARHDPAPRQLAQQMRRPCEHVCIIGRVVSEPEMRETPADRTRCEFMVQAEGLRRTHCWRRASGPVRVRWLPAAAADRPTYGDRWCLEGVLSHPPAKREWSGDQACRMEVEGPAARRISRDSGSRLVAFCLERRRVMREILGRGIAAFPEQVGVLRALMLGCREDIPEELYRAFRGTGTVHIFAVSGTHVAVFACLLPALLNALGLPRTRWCLLLAPLLGLYVVTTGMAVSAIRAWVMAVVFWLGLAFSRRPDGMSALAAAGWLILLAAPEQLFDLGFVLSFSAVAGLILLYPALYPKPILPAAADPLSGAPPAPWRRYGAKVCSLVAGLGAASVAAWLVTAPLTACYFNLASPIALAANLIVIPAAFVIMLTGCLALLSATVSVWLGEIFNHANVTFISWLMKIIEWAAAVPGGHGLVPAPSGLWLWGWYGLLAIGLLAAGRRRAPVWLAAGGCLALAALWSAAQEKTTVDILDVGEGSAALVVAPGCGVLVDTGPRHMATRVLRALRERGVDELQILVISHPDAEHAGAAAEILHQVRIRELWCPAPARAFPQQAEWLRAARLAGVPVRRLRRGDRGVWPGGVEWEVLHPPAGLHSARADEASLVLRLARGRHSILFMGDADGAIERAIVQAGIEPAAEALVVGAHGDRVGSTPAFLALARPQTMIVSTGPENQFAPPHPEILARAQAVGAQVRRTDWEGVIQLTWDE